MKDSPVAGLSFRPVCTGPRLQARGTAGTSFVANAGDHMLKTVAVCWPQAGLLNTDNFLLSFPTEKRQHRHARGTDRP